MSSDLLAILIFAGCWLLCFGLMLLYVYRTCWPKSPPKISFYITDLWAGTVGLAPTFLFIRSLGTDDRTQLEFRIACIALAVMSQGAGLAAGWMLAFDKTQSCTFGKYDRTIWLLIGEILLGPTCLVAAFGLFTMILWFMGLLRH
jgi:hypothetical protein